MTDLVTISSTKYIDDLSGIRSVDISNSIVLEFRDGNPEYIALARLREFKNREGVNIYNDVYFRTRQGRSNGSDICFNTYDYDTRKMRRKTEILQYKTNTFTSRETYRRNFGLKNPSKLSQYQLKLLRDTTNLSACNKTGGACNSLIFHKDIPFESKL